MNDLVLKNNLNYFVHPIYSGEKSDDFDAKIRLFDMLK